MEPRKNLVKKETLYREIDEGKIMKIVKHKFLDKYPITGKKILIIGTFNPDIPCNNAPFFYSRERNYFWELLPKVFCEKESFKCKTVEEKVDFLKRHDIELTDLINSVEWDEADTENFSDEKLKIITWNTSNIIDILKQGGVEEVYFTRETFNNIKNIKVEVDSIEKSCNEYSIIFNRLPTPARFTNETKLENWKKKFSKDVPCP